MRNVDLTTSGKFRCEVSGEAPLFQTATHTNVLIVVGELTLMHKRSSSYICVEFTVLSFEEVLTSQNFILVPTENVY